MPIFPLSKVKRALSPGRAPVTALELSSEESVGSAVALSAEQTGTLRDSDASESLRSSTACLPPRSRMLKAQAFDSKMYFLLVHTVYKWGKFDKQFLG